MSYGLVFINRSPLQGFKSSIQYYFYKQNAPMEQYVAPLGAFCL